MPQTSEILLNVLKFPFTLVNFVFMLAQLAVLYFIYSHRAEIGEFVNSIRDLVADIQMLAGTLNTKLADMDEIVATLRRIDTKLNG
jgi:hypothetical protein